MKAYVPTLMKDMLDQQVNSEDYIIDDRGKLLQVLPTEVSWRKELVMRVVEVRARGATGPPRYLPLAHALKASERLCSASEVVRRASWRVAYSQFVRPKQKAAVRQRRAKFQERGGNT